MLTESDTKYLDDNGYRYSTYAEGLMTLLVIEGYALPDGYEPQAVDLLIQVPSTYPDGNLDMWWLYPPVVFARNGAAPVNTSPQTFPGFTPEPGRQWQRFSRHPTWRPGIDNLRTFLRGLRSTLEYEVEQVAA